jgi:hypothetical protein
MKKDDFLAEFKGIILLENFQQARNDVMQWLRKQVEYQEKLQAKLDDARAKAFDNPAMKNDVQRLSWQVGNHEQGLAIIVAFIEASEMALEVFREKMLATIEMDSLKINQLDFYRKAWQESMNEVYDLVKARQKLLENGSTGQHQKQNTSQVGNLPT